MKKFEVLIWFKKSYEFYLMIEILLKEFVEELWDIKNLFKIKNAVVLTSIVRAVLVYRFDSLICSWWVLKNKNMPNLVRGRVN